MVYKNKFKDIELSALGFGTMRMPKNSDNPADINIEAVDEMVDYALANGINYFDTAYMYHDHKSEGVIGKSLSRYPRDSYYLATKYPGHEIHPTYNPEEIFENQLRNCCVDYFDFYLFHNVNENSIKTYLNPKWGFKEYFKKQLENGRIKHLGFSCHGDVECIKQFLEMYGDIVEFCQIQQNYLDWTMQNAKDKYDYLTSRGLGVWVMEPCRGGKLAVLSEENEKLMKGIRPDESIPSWAFRFLQRLDNVKVILSGMSSLDQMKDNVKTFSVRQPLDDDEYEVVLNIAEQLKNSVPCTSCRYCCEGCPMQINIPYIFSLYNDYRVYKSVNINIRYEAIDESNRPSQCIGCGQCRRVCPQGIDIPNYMKTIGEEFSGLESWEEICKNR